MFMLHYIKERIWPGRPPQAFGDLPSTKDGKIPVPESIVKASEKLNAAVTQLRDMAVDTKIQSDILHEQITGQPPPPRSTK